MTSVVMPAHNEAAVIAGNLRRLLADADPGEFEVIVVANGCSDGTAEAARSVPGVRVLELTEAGKPAALNAGEAAASGFPRLYLDADVTLSTAGARALAAAVGGQPAPMRPARSGGPTPGGPPVLAAAPRRVLDTRRRPLLVRAYFAVNGRLPAFRGALFGRGVIALSAAGRNRFDVFPDVVADDLFLDSLFLPREKREVSEVAAVVATPRRTRDLLRRLGRVRAGNAMLRVTGDRVPRSRRGSWLVDVVLPRPWLLPAGACYLLLTMVAELSARRPVSRASWGRDDSSRVPDGVR